MPVVSSSIKSRYGTSLRRTTIRQRYEEQVTAPDLLSLRDELSLVGARLAELLDQLDGKGVDFLALADAQHDILTYASLQNYEAVMRATHEMGALIEQGIRESEVWKEAYQVIEQRRKLVDTEMKTLNTIGAMLSMEQVMLLLGKLVAAVTLHISDRESLAKIHGEFSKVLDLVPSSTRNSGFAEVPEEE